MKRSYLNKICVVGILSALYLVFSLTLKIPLFGNISLDLGYIVLMVAAFCLGGIPAAVVGGIGAALESILASPLGLSVGWVAMNVIIGLILGFAFYKYPKTRKPFIAIPLIILAAALGGGCKMIIECSLYSIPYLIKLPKILVAVITDIIVMIVGYPIANIVKKRLKRD